MYYLGRWVDSNVVLNTRACGIWDGHLASQIKRNTCHAHHFILTLGAFQGKGEGIPAPGKPLSTPQALT